MVRKKWPIAVGVACLALTAFRPAGLPIGWRQASEGNGYRSDEYGAFGVTVYMTNRPVSDLHVGQAFRAVLAATGLRNPPEVEAQVDKAHRTIRRGGIQYWLRVEVKSKPKDVIDAYAKQLAKPSRHPMPSGGEHLVGTAPDGKTRLRVHSESRGGKTEVMLTFGPGS